MPTTQASSIRKALFLIFTISGFAGLIYESIWSHYLKLLLGHAAYAQTLVLVLFMGGMAIGSFLCARFSERIRNPLLAYAGVELVLGLMALGFDPVFRATFDFVLNVAAPSLGDPVVIEAVKWATASLLILPACILLGATFPLISAGVLRLDPGSAGNALGWLYFTNSLGAVAGVLTSGFVLIQWVGLPGTLLTAGLCNFLLAFAAYGLGKRAANATPPTPVQGSPHRTDVSVAAPLLLGAAFVTGAASFMYEMGWIRMLSLVLGSATHSFELMLGAFILGLALGSLWVRNRIDSVGSPLMLLAWVQLLMGAAALASLVVYGWSFEWMSAMVRTLAKSEIGYTWFNVLSQAICWALMLPVTVFAGMTLPLITALVLRSSGSESAIGKVYSANTVGSIVGVVLAMHFVMPTLGLRNVVVLGAALDIALALWLFMRAGRISVAGRVGMAALLAGSLAVVLFVHFDPSRLASGVYRHGRAERPVDVVFHRDGRSASIDVTKAGAVTSILTNGKPDASLQPGKPTADDFTMILTGALPLAIRPDAKSVALIGMGSGRSTHVFLASPNVELVDTVEIEPAMVEGARYFGELVSRTFTDPRSHIYIEDAKTFFARHQKRYDIVMSEPSNPWVSGVASLFSAEFYRQIKKHIAPGGIFVQWLQLYEFDDSLVASVGRALGQEFADYAIYMADNGDILVVAVPEGQVPAVDGRVLDWPPLKQLSTLIGVNSAADLDARWLADKATASKFFDSSGVPPNSDFFPYLDQHAAKYRFMGRLAAGLVSAKPVTQRLADRQIAYGEVTGVDLVWSTRIASEARALVEFLEWRTGVRSSPPNTVKSALIAQANALLLIVTQCNDLEARALWKPAIELHAGNLLPFMDVATARRLTSALRLNQCVGETRSFVESWLDLIDSIAERNWDDVIARTEPLIRADADAGLGVSAFLVRELFLAEYKLRGPTGVMEKANALSGKLPQDPSIKFLLALSSS